MKIRNVDFLQISLMAGGGAAPPVRAPVKETMFEEMARKVFFFVLCVVEYQPTHCRKKREKQAKLKAASQEA